MGSIATGKGLAAKWNGADMLAATLVIPGIVVLVVVVLLVIFFLRRG